MSDTIPRFKIGDFVRIMQTDAMKQLGLAGNHGFIRDILSDPEQEYAVAEIEILGGNRRRRVSLASVSHCTRSNIA